MLIKFVFFCVCNIGDQGERSIEIFCPIDRGGGGRKDER
jgi:hypothetical protein